MAGPALHQNPDYSNFESKYSNIDLSAIDTIESFISKDNTSIVENTLGINLNKDSDYLTQKRILEYYETSDKYNDYHVNSENINKENQEAILGNRAINIANIMGADGDLPPPKKDNSSMTLDKFIEINKKKAYNKHKQNHQRYLNMVEYIKNEQMKTMNKKVKLINISLTFIKIGGAVVICATGLAINYYFSDETYSALINKVFDLLKTGDTTSAVFILEGIASSNGLPPYHVKEFIRQIRNVDLTDPTKYNEIITKYIPNKSLNLATFEFTLMSAMPHIYAIFKSVKLAYDFYVFVSTTEHMINTLNAKNASSGDKAMAIINTTLPLVLGTDTFITFSDTTAKTILGFFIDNASELKWTLFLIGEVDVIYTSQLAISQGIQMGISYGVSMTASSILNSKINININNYRSDDDDSNKSTDELVKKMHDTFKIRGKMYKDYAHLNNEDLEFILDDKDYSKKYDSFITKFIVKFHKVFRTMLISPELAGKLACSWFFTVDNANITFMNRIWSLVMQSKNISIGLYLTYIISGINNPEIALTGLFQRELLGFSIKNVLIQMLQFNGLLINKTQLDNRINAAINSMVNAAVSDILKLFEEYIQYVYICLKNTKYAQNFIRNKYFQIGMKISEVIIQLTYQIVIIPEVKYKAQLGFNSYFKEHIDYVKISTNIQGILVNKHKSFRFFKNLTRLKYNYSNGINSNLNLFNVFLKFPNILFDKDISGLDSFSGQTKLSVEHLQGSVQINNNLRTKGTNSFASMHKDEDYILGDNDISKIIFNDNDSRYTYRIPSNPTDGESVKIYMNYDEKEKTIKTKNINNSDIKSIITHYRDIFVHKIDETNNNTGSKYTKTIEKFNSWLTREYIILQQKESKIDSDYLKMGEISLVLGVISKDPDTDKEYLIDENFSYMSFTHYLKAYYKIKNDVLDVLNPYINFIINTFFDTTKLPPLSQEDYNSYTKIDNTEEQNNTRDIDMFSIFWSPELYVLNGDINSYYSETRFYDLISFHDILQQTRDDFHSDHGYSSTNSWFSDDGYSYYDNQELFDNLESISKYKDSDLLLDDDINKLIIGYKKLLINRDKLLRTPVTTSTNEIESPIPVPYHSNPEFNNKFGDKMLIKLKDNIKKDLLEKNPSYYNKIYKGTNYVDTVSLDNDTNKIYYEAITELMGKDYGFNYLIDIYQRPISDNPVVDILPKGDYILVVPDRLEDKKGGWFYDEWISEGWFDSYNIPSGSNTNLWEMIKFNSFQKLQVISLSDYISGKYDYYIYESSWKENKPDKKTDPEAYNKWVGENEKARIEYMNEKSSLLSHNAHTRSELLVERGLPDMKEVIFRPEFLLNPENENIPNTIFNKYVSRDEILKDIKDTCEGNCDYMNEIDYFEQLSLLSTQQPITMDNNPELELVDFFTTSQGLYEDGWLNYFNNKIMMKNNFFHKKINTFMKFKRYENPNGVYNSNDDSYINGLDFTRDMLMYDFTNSKNYLSGVDTDSIIKLYNRYFTHDTSDTNKEYKSTRKVTEANIRLFKKLKEDEDTSYPVPSDGKYVYTTIQDAMAILSTINKDSTSTEKQEKQNQVDALFEGFDKVIEREYEYIKQNNKRHFDTHYSIQTRRYIIKNKKYTDDLNRKGKELAELWDKKRYEKGIKDNKPPRHIPEPRRLNANIQTQPTDVPTQSRAAPAPSGLATRQNTNVNANANANANKQKEEAKEEQKLDEEVKEDVTEEVTEDQSLAIQYATPPPDDSHINGLQGLQSTMDTMLNYIQSEDGNNDNPNDDTPPSNPSTGDNNTLQNQCKIHYNQYWYDSSGDPINGDPHANYMAEFCWERNFLVSQFGNINKWTTKIMSVSYNNILDSLNFVSNSAVLQGPVGFVTVATMYAITTFFKAVYYYLLMRNVYLTYNTGAAGIDNPNNITYDTISEKQVARLIYNTIENGLISITEQNYQAANRETWGKTAYNSLDTVRNNLPQEFVSIFDSIFSTDSSESFPDAVEIMNKKEELRKNMADLYIETHTPDSKISDGDLYNYAGNVDIGNPIHGSIINKLISITISKSITLQAASISSIENKINAYNDLTDEEKNNRTEEQKDELNYEIMLNYIIKNKVLAIRSITANENDSIENYINNNHFLKNTRELLKVYGNNDTDIIETIFTKFEESSVETISEIMALIQSRSLFDSTPVLLPNGQISDVSNVMADMLFGYKNEVKDNGKQPNVNLPRETFERIKLNANTQEKRINLQQYYKKHFEINIKKRYISYYKNIKYIFDALRLLKDALRLLKDTFDSVTNIFNYRNNTGNDDDGIGDDDNNNDR